MRIRIRVLIRFIIFVIAANAERLTEKENEDRLKDCGRVKLPKSENTSDIAVDENAWVVRVHNKKQQGSLLSFDSLGSFISRKHVVTSSQTILNWNKEWTMDQAKGNVKCDAAGHLEVPEKYAKNIEIHSEHCADKTGCKKKSFQAEKAWILKLCEQKDYAGKYAVLLIEVKESDVEFGCLANQYTKWATRDSCHAYGIRYKSDNPNAFSANNSLREVVSTIKSFDTEFVYLQKYHQNGDRGGPLVVEVDNIPTIIGIGASPGLVDTKSETYFFNVQHYLIDFCFVVGICPPLKTTPAPSTTTEPTTVPETSSRSIPTLPTSSEPSVTTESPKPYTETFQPHPDWHMNRAPRKRIEFKYHLPLDPIPSEFDYEQEKLLEEEYDALDGIKKKKKKKAAGNRNFVGVLVVLLVCWELFE